VVTGQGGVWPELDVVLGARAEELAGLRRAARSWMHAIEVPPDLSGDVLVALSEAATNAVLHAYPPVAPGPVRVRGCRLGDEVELIVEDDGHWRERDGDHDGRGLGIIEALSTRLDVRRGGPGTRVVFRCALTNATDPA
jgi:anti-sigma regulatory factor (Ser/Thr protein kinase)